jgi:hypothetical protein
MTATTEKKGEPTQQQAKAWEDAIVGFWHREKVHRALLMLLVIDVCLVVASIALEIEFLQSKVHDCYDYANASDHGALAPTFGNYTLKNYKLALGYASVAIVCVFLLENLSLLVALRGHFLADPWHVFDLFVVLNSIWLELYFLDQPEGGLLILARSWRFVRIGHGFIDAQRLASHDDLHGTLDGNKEEILKAYALIKALPVGEDGQLDLCGGGGGSGGSGGTSARVSMGTLAIQQEHADLCLRLLAAAGQYLDGQRDTGTGETLVKRYTLPSEMAARATAKGSGLTPRSRRKAAAARNSAGVADPGFAVPLPATGVDKADEDEDAALGRV